MNTNADSGEAGSGGTKCELYLTDIFWTKTKYNQKAMFKSKMQNKKNLNPKQETGDTRGNTRNLRGTSLKHQQQTDKVYMGNQGLNTQTH